jgi:glutathione synthase
MDPIGTINPKKDSTLAMLLEAQKRSYQLEYMELGDLRLRDGRAEASVRPLEVMDALQGWFELGERSVAPLGDLDVILMRKDPPFDLEYTVATYVLERAEEAGAMVVNRPRSLRDVNEKIFASQFPQVSPPSLLTRSMSALRTFLDEHQTIVLKPVDAMGGRSVYVVRSGDPNTNVIFEEMTRYEHRSILAQAYLQDVESTGDKRVLLVDGEPVPCAITRIPAPGEHRANLAAGATATCCELTDRDREICRHIGPTLSERGLLFVGIDIIGGSLTEINVTSPTCIREIAKVSGVDAAKILLDAVEARLRW